MKATKITTENVQLIAFRLKQFFNRYECTQSYTDWGWFPKQLNRMGVKPELGKTHVERTITSYATKDITNVRISDGYGIVINIGKASAYSLEFGYKIKISSSLIKITGYYKDLKRSFTSYHFPCSDVVKATNSIDFEEMMNAQYWKDVEEEYLEDNFTI